MSILQEELKMPPEQLRNVILDLYECGYIEYRESNESKRNSIYVTSQVNNNMVSSWKAWTVDYKEENKKNDEYKWDDLYIPENFDKI